MKKLLLALAAMFSMASLNVSAAMFEASPEPLQESSENVVITFNALESGVDGLKGLSTNLYAHIGVYTNLSPNTWSYVKTDWGENIEANTFKRVAANTYQLTINDLRTYFGVTNASEHITKICIIARTADGTAQTSDQFIDVYGEGFFVSLKSNTNPTITKATEITFTASATESATITFYVDGTEVKKESGVKSATYTRNFSTVGAQNEIKAVATNGSETAEEVINVFYVKPSEAATYPGGVPKQGAVKNADGSVTFCLAAPGKSSVILVGSWDNYQALAENTMKYQDYNGFRYFWHTVNGLDNSSYYMYYYFVDGKYKVGDPYAKLVLDHISDKWLDSTVFPDKPAYPYSEFDDTMLAVYKGDIDEYDWNIDNFKLENPKSMVVYELLFRDFTGDKGETNGNGNIRMAIEKLPYIYELGVTAVELMPVMEFDGNNSWGYNTNSYMALDKAYGSPSDLREFIDKCHECGIAVILDIVFNHTPGLHPWYAMYDAGTSPFYNVTAPHNYSVYEDIKQEYGLVEQHWIDVLTYWLTAYKVDGFRFDLVKGLGDTSSYANDYDCNKTNTTITNRMKRLHAAMKAVNPNVIHINEYLGNVTDETVMGNDGQYQWNNQNGNGCSYASGSSSADLKYLNSANCSRPACTTVDYVESHDEQWIAYAASKAGIGSTNRAKRSGSIAAQMLLSPGPKMIWQYGEIAYDKELPTEGRTDPKYVPVDAWFASAARAATHDNFMDLCWLRRSNPDMFDGSATITYNNPTSAARSIRVTKGDREIVAFINANNSTSNAGVTVTTTKLNANNCQLITASQKFEPTLNGTGTSVNVSVPGHSFCVYATKNVAGVDNIVTDDVIANAADVVGGNGEIIILGEYENVAVYNMSGIAMPSLKVAPGIYIVNVDGNVTKVIVK